MSRQGRLYGCCEGFGSLGLEGWWALCTFTREAFIFAYTILGELLVIIVVNRAPKPYSNHLL